MTPAIRTAGRGMLKKAIRYKNPLRARVQGLGDAQRAGEAIAERGGARRRVVTKQRNLTITRRSIGKGYAPVKRAYRSRLRFEKFSGIVFSKKQIDIQATLERSIRLARRKALNENGMTRLAIHGLERMIE